MPARPPHRTAAATLGLTLGLTGTALLTPAAADGGSEPRRTSYFAHAGSFYLQQNQPPAREAEPTSAEIVAFDRTGDTLLYTDGLTGRLGLVDTSDIAHPRPAGTLQLPGDPTSVAVHGRHALVAVVTSEDPDGDGPLNEYDAPAGELLVLDVASRSVVSTLPLAGQPDSVSIAPSGRYAAIAIENERDEDEADGLIPQPPAGLLQVLDLRRPPHRWSLASVDLTGLADVAPSDPEPEYVDINRRDQAVVSLQENNHLVVVDLRTRRVRADFSAGTVDVDEVDVVEEEIGPQGAGLISLDGSLTDRRREPDSVQWVDDDTFATANEGDYTGADGVEGGTRSFTLFRADGRVEFEAGNRFEHALVRAGHYPESRSENKGVEPEGLEVARIDGQTYLFVASERGNAVGVYRMRRGRPVLHQVLPTGIGPEGLVVAQDVLAVSAEVDGADEGFAARPFISLFDLRSGGRPAYPMLTSGDEAGLPIPWVAQSGLAGDPHRRDVLWSVSDSVLGQAFLYRIDVSRHPARITRRLPVGATDVSDPSRGDFDLEGVAVRPEGGFWLASEGRVGEDGRPNLVLRVAGDGAVLQAAPLPEGLAAGATSNGLEGIAVTGTARAGNEQVWVVVQREWADDPAGQVKIGRYDVATGSWSFAAYPLDPVESPAGGWVGLSELTLLPDGALAVLERDNQIGLGARVKRVYRVDPASVEVAPYGEPLPLLDKTLLADLLPVLGRASVGLPDKPEGLGITRDGRVFVVTDNDGVEENYGETVFTRVRLRTAPGG